MGGVLLIPGLFVGNNLYDPFNKGIFIMKKHAIAAGTLTLTALLVACGGGGGGGYTPNPGPTSTLTPTTTTATGMVVDDPSGSPLAGITVRLEPWIVYPTPGPSPTPVASATTDPSGKFSITAANGHYLLVIGSDDSSDTTRPTIHDNVMLNGGAQALVAPTMPPIPGVTPPAAETGGNYRLATIDQTHEIPCITAYDQQRANAGLTKPVIDEWLTENTRMVVEQSVTPYRGQTDPRNPFGFINSAGDALSGGSTCADAMVRLNQPPDQTFFNGSFWFAGSYYPYQSGSTYSAYGRITYPIDPRLFKDPNVPNWL